MASLPAAATGNQTRGAAGLIFPKAIPAKMSPTAGDFGVMLEGKNLPPAGGCEGPKSGDSTTAPFL